MNSKRLCAGLRPFFTGALLAALSSPANAGAVALDSAITEVTVYADRAQVAREGAVRLESGSTAYQIEGLPGWIDAGSVRAEVVGAEARIEDVRVSRKFLAETESEALREAEAALQETRDSMEAIEDRMRVVDSTDQYLRQIGEAALETRGNDESAPAVPVGEYEALLEFVSRTHNEIVLERRNLNRERRVLQPELNARQRRVSELVAQRNLEQSVLTVTISADAPADARLRFSYLIPGATWEPAHDLRAGLDGNRVEITSYAVVRQTTGEDWSNAAIRLSTQDTRQVAAIPELEAMLIGGSPAVPVGASKLSSVNSSKSFAPANENYLQNRAQYFIVNYDLDQNAIIQENLGVVDARQRENEKTFERISSRGTSTIYAAEGTRTIRTDGRPVRLVINSAELDSDKRVVVVPELSLNAVRVAEMTFAGEQPLLPGRASLFVDDAFIGPTELEFAAPGEAFEVYLGVEDRIKVERRLDRDRSRIHFSGKTTELDALITIGVENLSDGPISVQVAERVPVSKNEEVRVRDVDADPRADPDEAGVLAWDLELQPHQKQALALEYSVRYPTGFTLQQVDSEDVGGFGAADDQAPLRQQLLDLERQF